MKAFLIAVCLVTLVAVGLVAGYFVQSQRARDQAAQRQAEQAKAEATAPASATEDEDADEDDEAYMRDAEAKRALMDHCQVCHAPTMFQTQRLTQTQWKDEVLKMVGWGAALNEEDQPSVVEYLAKHYASDVAVEAPRRAALAEVSSREIPGDPHEGTTDADLDDGAKLYAANCASCHGPRAHGRPSMPGVPLGPALANRSELMHAKDYFRVLHDGMRDMPSMSAALTPEQQRDILGWLRSIPYDDDQEAPAPAATPKPES